MRGKWLTDTITAATSEVARSFGLDASKMTARDWQIEVLRFTFIGLSEESVKHLGSLQNLFGLSPETETNKKQQMSRSEETSWRKGQLSIVSQPRRVDIIYSAIQEDAVVLPKAGSFLEVGNELLGMLQSASGHKAGRVACGGVILLPVSDVEEGYHLMASLLPFVKFESDMREFAMQVNRPKMKDNLVYNELSKWSVATLRLMQFDANQGAVQGFDSESALRMEFDFNNAEFSPIPDGMNCMEMMRHLFERGSSVSQEGAQ